METSNLHTPEEIDSNINILKNREENLLRERKELNQRIKEVKNNIAYWENLDTSQTKLL